MSIALFFFMWMQFRDIYLPCAGALEFGCDNAGSRGSSSLARFWPTIRPFSLKVKHSRLRPHDQVISHLRPPPVVSQAACLSKP
jgi:hypothetical protein